VSQDRWYWLVLGVLAVWRVTHLLHAEHGPWGVVGRLRALAGRAVPGLFGCFYCLSLWTALPAAWWLESTWAERAVAWLAMSAAAIVIELRAVGAPADYSREEDSSDDMLR